MAVPQKCIFVPFVSSEEYAEFQGLAAMQKSLWTETSKAVVAYLLRSL